MVYCQLDGQVPRRALFSRPDGWGQGARRRLPRSGPRDRAMDRRAFMKLTSLLAPMGLPMSLVGKGRAPGRDANPDLPTILIVVFDALSAGNMSLYGYPRQTTPNIDRFADEAVVFHRHYSGANFTTPGTASILTGTLPWEHRAFHVYGMVDRRVEWRNIFRALDGSGLDRLSYTHNDLAEMILYQFKPDIDEYLRASDLALFYDKLLSDSLFFSDRDLAFLGEQLALQGSPENPASAFLSLAHKLWRTSETYNVDRPHLEMFPLGVPRVPGGALFLLEDAIDWLQARLLSRAGPFFGYLHFYPPHGPFQNRRDFIGIFDDDFRPIEKPEHFFSKGQSQSRENRRRQQYDEYIAYVDSEFGRLMDFIRHNGLLEDSLIILTSDHGQMFERGVIGHTTELLVEPLIHIPLVMFGLGRRARLDVHMPTSCIDLLPTVLELAGDARPDWAEGLPLPPYADEGIHAERAIFAVEAKGNASRAPLTRATVALIEGAHKLVHYFGYPGFEDQYEMYDLQADPEELRNLYAQGDPLADRLRDQLLAKLEDVNQSCQ
jgi:arylsulfatase A-like enzyme